MSKEARNRALEAICNAQGRTFLAAAPLMAIVEAVQVLDEAGLLVDPDVADLDLDAPIPYALAVPPPAKEPDPPPCENCCGLGWQCDPDAKVIRCDHCAVYETDEAAQEAKAAVDRLAAASTQRSPCPVCGQGLASNGECLNFPVCRNAIIHF